MHTHASGAGRATEDTRDFRVGPFQRTREEERLAIAWRQLHQRALQNPKPVIRRGRRSRLLRSIAKPGRIAPCGSPARGQEVETGVAGDAIQPRRDAGAVGETVRMPGDPQENILNRIIGGIRGAEQAAAKLMDACMMTAEQRVERAAVAFRDRTYERRIRPIPPVPSASHVSKDSARPFVVTGGSPATVPLGTIAARGPRGCRVCTRRRCAGRPY